MTEVLADRYELGELIGAGGMARVVEGYDRLLARRVAIKILRDDVTGDRTLPERFLREARTAASFSHPNAVTVYDTGREGRRSYIVMELVDGQTLADELAERGALPGGEAVEIAAEVLDALGAAHDVGFVHRDVKPGNVLRPRAGGVKLTDFGIAKSLGGAAAGLTATGTVLGTPKYLSPEQVAGDVATPATDVYAAGVVLYEMLAGAPPFDGDNAIAVAMAHQRDPVPPLARRRRDLDPDLVAVVEQALAKDPADRFPDAWAMRSALLDLPGGVRPVGAAATTVALSRDDARTAILPPGSAPPPAPPPTRPRRRWGRGALLAVLVVALLAAAVFAATRVGTGDPADEPTPDPSAPAVLPEDDAPADDAPADDVPADDAPADDAPADDAPADDVPADEPAAPPGDTAPVEPDPADPPPEDVPADGATEAP